MAYLSLKGIGKIYCSDGAVSVGIRGVDLDMERGEFVAVTGRSGSGKSTLLNVISGMDSYEEGELYIEGEPTSHFRQTEWEKYREEYISFIFQDYNIIESFTVYQNVELALMHIEDAGQRKRRALELIREVGLDDCKHRKGSRLSGGQKQRTVIARALAKDSPIILADEPCGNLDSATTEEIVRLLDRVSRDKLLIMVTHNLDEVADYATREVRIFDGEVTQDTRLSSPARVNLCDTPAPVQSNCEKKTDDMPEADGSTEAKSAPVQSNCEKNTDDMPEADGSAEAESLPAQGAGTENKPRGRASLFHRMWSVFKRGARLGLAIFTSKPKLTAFICMLTVIASIGASVTVSATSSAIADVLTRPTLFSYERGRLVVASRDGAGITEEKLAQLIEKTGASDGMLYDYILENGGEASIYEQILGEYFGGSGNSFTHLIGKRTEYPEIGFRYTDMPTDYVGRLPERSGEILLRLPISYLAKYSEKELLDSYAVMGIMPLEVVGVSFYADNNIAPICYMTKEGLENLALISQVVTWGNRVTVMADGTDGDIPVAIGGVYSDVGVAPDCEGVFINEKDITDSAEAYGATLSVSYSYQIVDKNYMTHSYLYSFGTEEQRDDLELSGAYSHAAYSYIGTVPSIIIGEKTLRKFLGEDYGVNITQASLFFDSDIEAQRAVETVKELGYSAVLSSYKYRPDAITTLVAIISGAMMTVMLVLTVIFLSFFVYICSSRALSATAHEVGIMRSMGIPSSVIRVGMYVRMAICFIPGALAVLAVAVLIRFVPVVNAVFSYLYLWQYIAVLLTILAISVRVTARQMRKLFDGSVKNTLRGGHKL